MNDRQLMCPRASIPTPDWIAHADWGSSHAKRWLSVAIKQPDGTHLLKTPRPVKTADRLLADLREEAGPEASILLGFDFPIGLPWKYARQIGQTSFLKLLPKLGALEWPEFYQPATSIEQVSLQRPFYPNKPGGSRQQDLIEALGVNDFNDLRRQCDLPTPYRRAAAAIFWTVGGQQVGKAAISGWQEVLARTVGQHPPSALIWPFNGQLATLLTPGSTVIAETYPAEYYIHLGLDLGRRDGQRKFGKRSQYSRAKNEPILRIWADNYALKFSPELAHQIAAGFGPRASGEDPFDAFIGVCGLLNLLLNDGVIYEPTQPHIQEMEGWILGLEPPGR